MKTLNAKMKIIFLILLFFGIFGLTGSSQAAWIPITGIPQPSFGVNEIAPAAPSPWNSGVAGFYYVCPTCAGHTDTSNPYGYPAKPRDTFPNPVPAGSVVEIHGQYDLPGTTLTVNGTLASPVFIRGDSYANRPKITGGLVIQGAYGIFENLWFAPLNSSSIDFGVSIYEGTDHIAVRHVEFSGNNNRSGGIGLGGWGYSGSSWVDNILIDNVYIHNLGQFVAGIDTDAHCITLNGSDRNVWIVNSELTYCTGDGTQIEAQSGRQAYINHIYFGNNKSHHNKQTGVWVKHAQDVIISSNEIYDFSVIDQFSGGAGTGLQYDNDYIWFINNKIHDVAEGIGTGSDNLGTGTHHYIIGNVIYNVDSPDDSNPHNYGAIKLRQPYWKVLNNTVYNYDHGFSAPYNLSGVEVRNNIWNGRNATSGTQIYSEAASAVFENNILDSTNFNVWWDWGSYSSLSAFRSGANKCNTNCVQTDFPGFVNAAGYNFVLSSGATNAIDKGYAHTAYSEFSARYGLSIATDIAGTARPQNGIWDIGAYEYVSSAPDTTPPAAPTGLTIN